MKNKTYQIVLKEIGNLMALMAFILIIPGIVALVYNEFYSFLGFLVSAIITYALGISLYSLYIDAVEPQFKQGYIIAALSWLMLTVMGSLPFLFIANITPPEVIQQFVPKGANYTSSLIYFQNPLHCFFESMSAYTTTGLTMTVHEPSVGKAILFYRSFAQWIGGAGFIVLVLALFKHDSGRSVRLLYQSESTGINLRNKVKDTTKGIWKSYVIITVFVIAYLIIGTYLILPDYPLADNIFDSINHAMSGLSSGGFSTLDDNIAGYHSAAMDYLYLLPMILGSFSLPFYYRIIFKGKFSEIWKDVQTRSLLICFSLGSLILTLLLLHSNVAAHPLREGIFHFISAMSTTGWHISNIQFWDERSLLFIIFAAMFIGGAWGGTVGGIKIYRAALIQKGIRWQIKKEFFSQNTIKTLKFDGKVMLPDEANAQLASASIYVIIFFLILLGSTFITTFFLPANYSFIDALFESTAAQSTSALSVGITNPSMHPVVEITYIIQMWLGRLEIIPVLALFRSTILGTNPKIL